jgi:hypothetical protein
MLKLVLALFLVSVPLASAHAERSRRSREDQRGSLVVLLSAYELRLDRAGLAMIGPDVPTLLIDIANTPREAPTVRTRALAGLAFYPDATTKNFLASLLNERSFEGTNLGRQLRRQAMRSFGKAFGDAAIDELVALKDDADPLVREGVALALGDAASARALPMLQTWLVNESVFTVHAAIDAACERLRRL